MDRRKPIVLAFAGPNGSGKTAVARKLPVVGTYVNADGLKREYCLTDIYNKDNIKSSTYPNRFWSEQAIRKLLG